MLKNLRLRVHLAEGAAEQDYLWLRCRKVLKGFAREHRYGDLCT